MSRHTRPRDEGFSLTELMVSMFITSLVIVTTVALTITFQRTNAQNFSRQEQIDTARHTIVIRTGERTRTARLAPQTVITIDGFPGDVRDLRPGQRATVQLAVTQGGAAREDAVRVDVRTR